MSSNAQVFSETERRDMLREILADLAERGDYPEHGIVVNAIPLGYAGVRFALERATTPAAMDEIQRGVNDAEEAAAQRRRVLASVAEIDRDREEREKPLGPGDPEFDELRVEDERAEREHAERHSVTGLLETIVAQNEQIVLLNDLQHLGKRERDAIVKKQNDILAVVGDAIRAVDGGRRADQARPWPQPGGHHLEPRE